MAGEDPMIGGCILPGAGEESLATSLNDGVGVDLRFLNGAAQWLSGLQVVQAPLHALLLECCRQRACFSAGKKVDMSGALAPCCRSHRIHKILCLTQFGEELRKLLGFCAAESSETLSAPFQCGEQLLTYSLEFIR